MEIVLGDKDVLSAIETYARKRISIQADEEVSIEIVRKLNPTSYSAKITVTKAETVATQCEEKHPDPEPVIETVDAVEEVIAEPQEQNESLFDPADG